MGYRTNENENAELTELREKLYKAENQLRKFQKREDRMERMSNWWRFCFWTFLGTILGAFVVFVTLTEGSSMNEIAQTESRAVQNAVEHFRSSRATARCFASNDHGMLCELRNGQAKVMARCDTETCWTSL